MNTSGLDQDQWGLLFDVRRSARYHDRRADYFALLHRITSLLTVCVSGFLFVELSGVDLPQTLRILASLAGAFAIFDFVVGYAQCADEHRTFRRLFCEFEADLAVADPKDADLWRSFTPRRIKIEIGEPPIYRALDLLCHNELMAADGYKLTDAEDRKHFAHLRFWHRWTAHFWRWPNVGVSAGTPPS